eukprot:TRINITY_DN1900_c0_g1_i4.p1 TRINITY_DN1900_c0_g1~~TRINITY_DN1900_c0_g1_i4.p1  ORF type:complete len:811 (+),score=122.94 TRINITY_DN1900_c0_g1_i4:318-2750(+)
MFKKLLECIQMLHERGFRHGSISPSSVFVTDSGEIKLGGFSTLSRCDPADVDSTTMWKQDIEDAARVVMFMLSSKLSLDRFLLGALVDHDLAEILADPKLPAFALIPIIDSFCGGATDGYVIQDIRHIASRSEGLLAESPRNLPLEFRFQYFEYLSMQAVLDIATNKQPSATSLDVHNNPFLCSDIASAILGRCDINTIQRLALANHEFGVATWALVKNYAGSGNIGNSRSSMQQMAASSPRLSRLKIRSDEECLIPLTTFTLRHVDCISVSIRTGVFPFALLAVDPEVVDTVELCFDCDLRYPNQSFPEATLRTALSRIFNLSAPQKVLRIKSRCSGIPGCCHSRVKPIILDLSPNIFYLYFREDRWLESLFQQAVIDNRANVIAARLSEVLQEHIGLSSNQVYTQFNTVQGWFLKRYGDAIPAKTIESVVSSIKDSGQNAFVLSQLMSYRHTQWFKTAFCRSRLTKTRDARFLYLPSVLDLLVDVAIYDIQNLHYKIQSHSENILKVCCALSALRKIQDPSLDTEECAKFTQLFENEAMPLLQRWSASMPVDRFLDNLGVRYSETDIHLSLDPGSLNSFSSAIETLVEAYECFDVSMTKLLQALEIVPECFSMILDRCISSSAQYFPVNSLLRGQDRVLFLILCIPESQRLKIVDPNILINDTPLWSVFMSQPSLFRTLVSHPNFNPLIRDSKGNLPVNVLLRHPELCRPEMLDSLLSLLLKEDASGWDQRYFPETAVNVAAVFGQEAILSRLALFCRDPKGIILSNCTIQAAGKFPDTILNGVKLFLDISWNLRFSSTTPDASQPRT